jgi:hypothetical protein
MKALALSLAKMKMYGFSFLTHSFTASTTINYSKTEGREAVMKAIALTLAKTALPFLTHSLTASTFNNYIQTERR